MLESWSDLTLITVYNYTQSAETPALDDDMVAQFQGMENVVAALNGLERKYGALFSKIFRSITVDNGSEFSDCEGMETSIFGGQRTKMYYCHPYSSYERGSNENLNKMFRRLFPKGTNFDEVPDEEIIAAADWMNNYPREILGRTTAARAFNEQLAQIMA